MVATDTALNLNASLLERVSENASPHHRVAEAEAEAEAKEEAEAEAEAKEEVEAEAASSAPAGAGKDASDILAMIRARKSD